MSETAQAILAATLSLPEDEREELVDRLLESLSPPDEWEEVSEAEFYAELERRAEEAARDPSVVIPWEVVKDKLWEDLDAAPDQCISLRRPDGPS
jgi:putative addiction module component (TIGR02574 family)